jgi:hypothetical protein
MIEREQICKSDFVIEAIEVTEKGDLGLFHKDLGLFHKDQQLSSIP